MKHDPDPSAGNAKAMTAIAGPSNADFIELGRTFYPLRTMPDRFWAVPRLVEFMMLFEIAICAAKRYV